MDLHQELRYGRVFYEPLYLLNIEKENNKYLFNISGSTANVYKISLYDFSGKIFCNCPDAKSHAKYHKCLCKHICFVIFKVLKGTVDKNNTNLFKNLFLSQEEKQKAIEKISNLDIYSGNDFTNMDLIEKFKKIKDLDPKTLFQVNKVFVSGDDCPICYNELEEKIKCVQCPVCNNILHSLCINKWLNMGNSSCPYCRSECWENFKNENCYINLDIN